MAEMRLTIQHENIVYEPPVEEGVQIEWERTGTPGKLTFTVVKTDDLVFTEGDPVCFYYAGKPVFKGYVFTKKRDREQLIKVTCYDQIRYLKNKFSYSWEKKTASQIIKALCQDMNLEVGTIDNTNYVIPAIAEENKSAIDIILDVLEETLTNTGDSFVLYDDCGKLQVRNVAEMMCSNLIYSDTAENYDYSSSIDDETYNQVVLYYKEDDKIVQLYTATCPSTMRQWGTLRYFEEVKSPTIGKNKAISLLKLYNKRTRELKVSGAFGDISVRGGTLIPVQLALGDIDLNNFMLVEKVTHKFDYEHHTMDLTLYGHWEDSASDVVTDVIGSLTDAMTSSPAGGNTNQSSGKQHTLTIYVTGTTANAGSVTVQYVSNGKPATYTRSLLTSTVRLKTDHNTKVKIIFSDSKTSKGTDLRESKGTEIKESKGGGWTRNGNTLTRIMTSDASVTVSWHRTSKSQGGQVSVTAGGNSFTTKSTQISVR